MKIQKIIVIFVIITKIELNSPALAYMERASGDMEVIPNAFDIITIIFVTIFDSFESGFFSKSRTQK